MAIKNEKNEFITTQAKINDQSQVNAMNERKKEKLGNSEKEKTTFENELKWLEILRNQSINQPGNEEIKEREKKRMQLNVKEE